MRILVVEDEPDIAALIQMRLLAAGHQVVTVGDGFSALDLFDDTSPPEFVVLDVGLPGMDGYELLTALRRRPGQAELPAVFLSARVQDEDVEKGRALGANYLTKPFVATALLREVERFRRPEPPRTGW